MNAKIIGMVAGLGTVITGAIISKIVRSEREKAEEAERVQRFYELIFDIREYVNDIGGELRRSLGVFSKVKFISESERMLDATHRLVECINNANIGINVDETEDGIMFGIPTVDLDDDTRTIMQALATVAANIKGFHKAARTDLYMYQIADYKKAILDGVKKIDAII